MFVSLGVCFPNNKMPRSTSTVDTFLKVFLNHLTYEKNMCKYMKRTIFQEIVKNKYFKHRITANSSLLYFIRIRKDRGDFFKIGLTHNNLINRITSINNGDFYGVGYRIILIGCTRIRGQTLENEIKKVLKLDQVTEYAREKRDGTYSTESYRVSSTVYNKVRYIYEKQKQSTTFWSDNYKIDNNDKESYCGTCLGENDIVME